MKFIKGVIISENGDGYVLVTAGEAVKVFSGMIKLNKTAAFIAECMKEPTDIDTIVSKMLEKYDVTPELARKSAEQVVGQLKSTGLVEE